VENMKVLVTGARGYLGAHVSRHLVQNGMRVRAGTRDAASTDPGITEVRHGDILELGTCRAWVDGIDVVVHLAMANEVQCRENPNAAFASTVNGTLNLLSAASAVGVKKFVLVSTIHSYGRLSGDIHEKTLPQPLNTYGSSHHAAEVAVGCEAFAIEQKYILRLSHVVGRPLPHSIDRWSLLPNQLCLQAMRKKEIRLMTDGRPLLSFLTATDAVRGIAHIVQNTNRHGTSVFNLGSQHPLSILAFAQRIADKVQQRFGYLPNIICSPSSGGEQTNFSYNTRALLETGFRYSDSIDSEIDEILNAILENEELSP